MESVRVVKVRQLPQSPGIVSVGADVTIQIIQRSVKFLRHIPGTHPSGQGLAVTRPRQNQSGDEGETHAASGRPLNSSPPGDHGLFIFEVDGQICKAVSSAKDVETSMNPDRSVPSMEKTVEGGIGPATRLHSFIPIVKIKNPLGWGREGLNKLGLLTQPRGDPP
jgi:hypothetical protein